MKNKIHDPVEFVQNLVTRKGKSDLYGVYLPVVTFVAEADVDYGYPSDEGAPQQVQKCFSDEKSEWNSILVDTRLLPEEIVFPISFLRSGEPVNVLFIPEGNDMSCHVTIPKLVVDEIAGEVSFFQEILRKVSAFAGKTATTVKFTVGVVSLDWDDMVERGAAQEVDVGF